MNVIKGRAAVLVVLLCSSTEVSGEDLVRRDDFICMDTAVGTPKTARWPSVGIDSEGRICQIHQSRKPADAPDRMRLILDRLNRDGQPLESGKCLLPYEEGPDSIWWPIGLAGISTNEAGETFIPVTAKLTYRSDSILGTGVLLFTFDSSGSSSGEPVRACLMPPDGNNFIPGISLGAMNNNGLCGAAWLGRQLKAPFAAKVIVCLFDARQNELSRFIVPTNLTYPMSLAPAGRGTLSIPSPPCVAIDDAGGFVVAWVVQSRRKGDVCYVVYDSSGVPITGVQLANCQPTDVPTDTSECSTVGARTLSVAGEADGDFHIVWSNSDPEAPDYRRRTHVWMRGFHADGSPKYDPVQVDDSDSTNLILGQFVYPSIACDDYGNVIVTWPDARLHPENHETRLRTDVFIQRFDSTGAAIGPNRRVNNISGVASVKGTNHDCALNSAGQTIVVWRDYGPNSTIRAELVPLSRIGQPTPGNLENGSSAD